MFSSVIAAGALIGVLFARRSRGGPLERTCWIVMPAAAVALALTAWSTFRLLPASDWSACRLAASVRLAWGFPLYTPAHGAVMNDWMYGPVAALAYTPAALASDPQSALFIAAALNGLYYFLPGVLLFAPLLLRPSTRLMAALGFIFCLGAHFAPVGTWHGAGQLHVDCVTVCLGALSCLAITRGRHLTVAAVLCVLAIGAKQTDAPLALAQLSFLAWTDGRRGALAYLLRLALVGAVVAAIFCVWFGASTLWHDAVAMPSRFPLELRRLPYESVQILLVTFWMWPVVWLVRKTFPRTPLPAGEDASGWLLVLAGLFLLPAGLLAALKAGGTENSIHSFAYGMLGATFVGLRLLLAPGPRAALAARAALLAGIFVVLAIDLERVITFEHFSFPDPGGRHREAFDFARAHPGQAYFPWDTLATLMAEHRDDPFDQGVADWRTAGDAPEAAAIRKALPATLAFVVYYERDQAHEMLRVFPDFSRLHVSGQWLVYTRPPAPESSAPTAP